MASRIAYLGVPLLILSVFLPATVPLRNTQPIRYETNITAVRSANDLSINSSADLSALLPGRPAPAQQFLFSSTGSGSNTYYVGAQAPTAICSSACTYPTNSGAQTTIQVVSQQVDGCLAYWIGDDSGANIWGQVGYYICNGSTPVAFYQIWNLTAYSVLVTGASNVTEGYHQFSMYLTSGTTWAYAVDGNVLGTYDMGANTSMPAYPVQALSEEGYVSAPWIPAQVTFSNAIQTLNSGVWFPVPTSFAYSAGCNSEGFYATYSCWGAQGNLQNSTIAADAVVVGGSTPLILSGSWLWSGATSLTLTCTPSSPVVGSSSTCEATVTGSSPTGEVAWSSSGSGRFSALSCKLSAGSCTTKYTLTSYSSPVTVTANYLGDGHNPPSSGNFNLTAAMKASTTKVSCTPASVVVGSSRAIKCTATVTGYSPTGNVTWSQSGTGSVAFASATCVLSNGRCYMAMTAASAGTAIVQGAYGGDGNNTLSSKSVTLTIKQARTSLSMSCTPSSVVVGSNTTCTATLKGYANSVEGENLTWSQTGGTGSVTFSSAICTLSGGSCSVNMTGDGAGKVAVLVEYQEDGNNAASSKSFTLKFKQAKTALSVSCAPLSVAIGLNATCTATLTGYAGSVAGETVSWSQLSGKGSVSFSSATCTLSGGSCSVNMTGDGAGSVLVRIQYQGDAANTAVDPAVRLRVMKMATQASLSCSSSSLAVGGSSTTCTVTVSGYSPTGSVKWSKASGTGKVIFSSATCSLSSGTCSVTVTATAEGSVTIEAVYGRDSNNLGSSTTYLLTIDS